QTQVLQRVREVAAQRHPAVVGEQRGVAALERLDRVVGDVPGAVGRVGGHRDGTAQGRGAVVHRRKLVQAAGDGDRVDGGGTDAGGGAAVVVGGLAVHGHVQGGLGRGFASALDRKSVV